MGTPQNVKLKQARSIIERYLLDGGDPASADVLLADHPHLAESLRAELGKLAMINAGMEGSCHGDPAEQEVARSLNSRIAIPGYEMIDRIGTGGQATVLRAKQTSTGQQVAIKAVHGGAFLSDSARERFDREIRILADLNHPYVVSILDRGTTDEGTPFVVMRYVEGDDLDDWVVARRAGSTPPMDAAELRYLLSLFIKICEAVNAAHELGVTHRDIKPSNIRIDAQGSPRILDFGLATAHHDTVASKHDVTQTGQFVGSLPWSSPEQLRGQREAIDARSDVYSLAVTLYEMLTGTLPYSAATSPSESLARMERRAPIPIGQHLRQRVRSASGNQPGWTEKQLGHLDAVVSTALAFDLKDRYSTAGALASDLSAILDGRAPTAAANVRRNIGWVYWSAAAALSCAAILGALAFFGSGPRETLLTGRVWIDTNRDGVVSAGESGLAGVTVFADVNGDGELDDEAAETAQALLEPSTVTDPEGKYELRIPASRVKIHCLAPHNLVATFPSAASSDFPPMAYWLQDAETLWYVPLVKTGPPDLADSQKVKLALVDGAKDSEDYWVKSIGRDQVLVSWLRTAQPEFRYLALLTRANGQWRQRDLGHVAASWAIKDGGDVNGDGRLDLLIAAGEQQPSGLFNWSLMAALGQADGTVDFSKQPIHVFKDAWRLHVFWADMNHDDIPDCVYQLIPSGGQFILAAYVAWGVGDGTFDFSDPELLFERPEAPGLSISHPVDFDQDGQLDCFLAADDDTYDAGQCYIAFSRGDGRYELVESLDAFPRQEEPGQDLPSVTVSAVCDIDLDGNVDLVASCGGPNSEDRQLRLYRGSRQGRFNQVFRSLGAAGGADYEIWNSVAWSTSAQPLPTESVAGVQPVNAAGRDRIETIDFGFAGTDWALAPDEREVSGLVWQDVNRNGLLDDDERGMAGVRVFADSNSDGTYSAGTIVETAEPSALTDQDGHYRIVIKHAAVPLRCVLPPDQNPTFPYVAVPAPGRMLIPESLNKIRELSMQDRRLGPDDEKTIELSPARSHHLIDRRPDIEFLEGRDLLVRWRSASQVDPIYRLIWEETDYSMRQVAELPASHGGTLLADVDHDGRLDMLLRIRQVVPNGEADFYLKFARGHSDGSYDLTAPSVLYCEQQRGFNGCLIDMDGDQKPDLLFNLIPFGGYFTAALDLARGHGDGTFEPVSEAARIAVGPGDHGLIMQNAADFDADGDLDVFLAPDDDTQDAGQGYLALNDGTAMQLVESIDFFPDDEEPGQDRDAVVAGAFQSQPGAPIDLVAMIRESAFRDDPQFEVRYYRGEGDGTFDLQYEQLIAADYIPYSGYTVCCPDPVVEDASEPGVHEVLSGRSNLDRFDFGIGVRREDRTAPRDSQE